MQAKKIFHKGKPKQNFQIDYEKIDSSKLSLQCRGILIKTLRHHKSKCRFEYINLLNTDICHELGITTPTLIKYRQVLIDNHFFKLNKVRNGKSFLIEYRFTWKKLEKLGFIKPIEKSEFSPITKPKKVKEKFIKKETELTFSLSQELQDDMFYQIKVYKTDENECKVGIGICERKLGKDIKKSLKIQEESSKYGDKKEFIYIKN